MKLLFEDPTPRRFLLVRNVDSSGISGTGVVASGVQFRDSVCAVHWNTSINTTTTYESISDVESLHGHNGDTLIEWVDESWT